MGLEFNWKYFDYCQDIDAKIALLGMYYYDGHMPYSWWEIADSFSWFAAYTSPLDIMGTSAQVREFYIRSVQAEFFQVLSLMCVLSCSIESLL